MQIQVNKVKRGLYLASYGEWKADGQTPAAAKNNLLQAIQWYSEQNTSPVHEQVGNTHFVLHCSFYGWEYEIYTPDHASSCLMGRITKQQAMDAMLRHCQQYAA